MRDIAAQFREFARLDLARLNQGLSVFEHERWTKLKASLDQKLPRSAGAGAKAGTKTGAKTGKNRRSSSRVATRINCAYSSGDDHCEAVVSNLSTGGVYIRTLWPLAIGAEIRLAIQLEDTGREILVEGLVVSNNVDVSRGEDVRGMGVRFARVDSDAAEQLSAVYAAKVSAGSEVEAAQERVA